MVVGVDVGGRRKGFHCCGLEGRRIVAGPERVADVDAAVDWVAALGPTVVGLDSPISCAPDGERSRADERALASAVCGIRWTPERAALAGNPYYEWIEHGLELYEALSETARALRLIEVFPTAAWTIWAGPRGESRRTTWSQAALDGLELDGMSGRRLSQDDRDSIAAALVARLDEEGRSEAFGEIRVPVPGDPA